MIVHDLITQSGVWNVAKLHTVFKPADVNAIIAIWIPLRDKLDRLIWSPVAANGCFFCEVDLSNPVC